MKKLSKIVGILFLLCILGVGFFIFLLYSPSKDYDFNNTDAITVESIMSNSLNDVNFVNGGHALINYKDIENYLNKKIVIKFKNEQVIKLKGFELDGNNKNDLSIKAYANIELLSKFHFPISITLKTHIESDAQNIIATIKKVKLSKIPIPYKIFSNILNDKIDLSSLKENEIIKDIDLEKFEIKIDYSSIISRTKAFGEISDFKIEEEGLSIKIKPNEFITEIFVNEFKPAVSLINTQIEKLENKITSPEQKEVLKNVKNIIVKLEENKIEEIKVSDVTKIADDINNFDEDNKKEFIQIILQNIDKNSQQEIINTFSEVLSKEKIKELQKTFNTLPNN